MDGGVPVSTRILPEPRANGSRGPLPRQLDWLDHRLRKTTGNVSDTIPFQRPGWCSPKDWDAYRKAATEGRTYTVEVKVRPTLESLRRYCRHLAAVRSARELDGVLSIEPVEDHVVWIRSCDEIQLRQYAYARARGWMPWALAELRGTNIVIPKNRLQEFTAWKKANR